MDYEGLELISALKEGLSLKIIKEILAVPGLDIHAKDEYGNTALMIALRCQASIEIIKEILAV